MRRLIRGDIFRILRKIGFYILPIIYYILFIIMDVTAKNVTIEDYVMVMDLTCSYISAFAFGIPVFLGVYADELKSGAMQISIGRGISRKKIVLCKYINCVFLGLFLYIIDYIMRLVLVKYIYMINLTPLQNMRMILILLSSYLKMIGAIGFCTIFVFITWNASIGMVVMLISLSVIEPMLKMIQSSSKLPAFNYSYMGQVEQTCNNLAVNSGWCFSMLIVFAYIALFNLIGIIIFGRKELEL